MSPLFVYFQANLEGSLHGKTKTRGVARELKREGSKRRNIAELLGYEDSGGEMVRKTRIRARARVRSNFLRAVFGVIFLAKVIFCVRLFS